MNYIEAMKIQKRMLGTSEESLCDGDCHICPYHKDQTRKDCTCEEFPVFYPELAEAILAKWNMWNPAKTRMEVFLKAFPDAPIEPSTRVPVCCVEDIWQDVHCEQSEIIDELGYPLNNCVACWNAPAE